MKLSRRLNRPARSALAAAVVATFASNSSSSLAIDIPTMNLDSGIKVVSIEKNLSSLNAFPVIPSVPINGFEPKVVFTLTTKDDDDDFVWTATKSTSVQGNYITNATTPHYAVATIDSGGQTHLIANNQMGPTGFDLDAFNREGNYTSELGGASGTEDADISDALALYATGMGNVTSGVTPTVNPATLKGQYNVSVLSSQAGSSLPSLVGLPLFAQYGVSIRNSETYTRTVGNQTYKSPNVTLTDHNPASNSPYLAGLGHRAVLDLADPSNSATSAPAFLPSFDNFQNLHDNPTTPSFWAFPFVGVNYSHTDGPRSGDQFLFDTGAQVTVLSEQRAADVGFDVFTDTPDFTVEVAGVGGSTTEVPGFYLQSFTISANGGALSLTNVPVLVLNIVDPHDGVGFVDGIVGMNMFYNRDMFLNLNTSDPYVRWGEAIDAKWKVNSNGNWSTDANWLLGVPNAVDDPANFTDAINVAHNVTVDVPVKVGSMTFNNASKYTISGSQTITVEASVTGSITDTNGSHDITAPVAINSDTLFSVTNAADKLKLTQLQTTTKSLTKTGSGKLEVNAVRASGLNINGGTVEITANGGANSVSVLKSLSITGAGSKLDLHNNDLVVDYTGGSSPYSSIVNKIKTGLVLLGGNGSGIGSTEIDAQTIPGTLLGVVDNGAVGGAITGVSGYNGLPTNSVIVKYTWMGDCNIDGKVDMSDYILVDTGYTSGGTLGGWVFGDFNYDGLVDNSDYIIIDTGFSNSTTVLPEPASLALLGLGGFGLLRRRFK